MTAASDWFRAELLADVALAAMLLEAAVLALRARRTRRGPPLRALLGMLLPGALLLLALRAAATGADTAWVAVWLTGALFAHLADLRERQRRPLDTASTSVPSGRRA